MALWIEFHVALRDHYKVTRLAKLLGIKYTEALGTLGCLWTWASVNRREGDLTKIEPDEIAHACRWDGEPDKLIKALQRAEFLDELKIHDWNDHGLRLLNNARDRMKEYRDTKRKAKRSTWRQLHKWIETSGGTILGLEASEAFTAALNSEFDEQGEAWTLKHLKELAEWFAKYPQQAKAIGHPEAYALAALKKMRGNPEGVRKIREIVAQMAQAKSA